MLPLKFNCTLHSRSEFLRHNKLQKTNKFYLQKPTKFIKIMYLYLYDRDVAPGCLSNLTFGQEKEILNFTKPKPNLAKVTSSHQTSIPLNQPSPIKLLTDVMST
jgi:hypothetical protein